jgi:hypothetical protein
MYEALATQLAHEADKPYSKDERIAAFSKALFRIIEHGELHGFLDGLERRDSETPPSSATRLVLRALQKQLMLRDVRYPQHYDNETAWLDAFNRLREDPAAMDTFSRDLATRQLQSNVVERYKAFKLALWLMQPLMSGTPRVLDVGCSRNHGLKKIKLNLPFRPVACGLEDDDYPGELLSASFNSLISAPLPLGRSVGADIVPINGGEDAAWARSCSFSPNELLDPGVVTEYDYLEHVRPADIHFKTGDFAGGGLDEEEEDDKFDAVTASTFLYQLAPEKRVRAREIFRKYLSKSGVVIYQDFAGHTPDHLDLEFEDDWTIKYRYRTMVEFAGDPSGRLYELFRWDYGRCGRWQPGADIAELLPSR